MNLELEFDPFLIWSIFLSSTSPAIVIFFFFCQNYQLLSMDREIDTSSLEQFMIPPNYISKHVDISALSKDSLERVAELSRRRREQLLQEEDEEVKMQEQKGIAAGERNEMAEDERLEREQLIRLEEKERDALRKRGDSHSIKQKLENFNRVRLLEERRDKKIRALQQEIAREVFRATWQAPTEHRHSPRPHMLSSSPQLRQQGMREATILLRHAHEYAVPPFATDPEECWGRGVTVAPDLQHGAIGTSDLSKAKLPSYHELGAVLRQKFAEAKGRGENFLSHPKLEQPMSSTSPERFSPRSSPFATFVGNHPLRSPN